jgi:hypothetical protein
MSILSKIRRTIINEGNVYKASDLFPINEEIYFEPKPLKYDDRDFLKSCEIPTYYKLLGGGKNWDIKEKCVGELELMSKRHEPVGDKPTPLHLKTLDPEDIKKDDITLNNYCKLYNTYQHSNNKDKYINDLSTVFWFMRPNEKDNRVKFHNLIRVINDAEDPEGSINILSDKIKEDLTDQDGDKAGDIKKALKKLKGKQKLSKDSLIKILKSAKYSAYKNYEDSFVGQFFRKHSKIYKISYKEALEEKGFKNLLLKTYYELFTEKGRKKSNVNFDEIIDHYANKLVLAIKKLYKPEEVAKADLKANENILDINGNVVIPEGKLVEVKMRDYTKASYLSEYFGIYKREDNLDGRFKRGTMKSLYNKFISKVFDKFKELPIGDSIIEEIRRNTSGIIFGENPLEGNMVPIYVPLDNIDLWWSEEGKKDPTKEKRLTIRYHIKNPNKFYYYSRENGTMIPNNLVESYDLKEVSNLLLEGRKEDLIKKYSKKKKSKKIINKLSDGDPSGNNKYLPWMVKIYYKEGWESTTYIINLIELFHKNIQRIKNKDINSYKSFDSLSEVVEEAEKKRKEAELKKEVKKQKTVIYEDDRWFVVSPHSWKASCFYGAGTKWCVTSKDTKVHWDNYSKRASFFYIIDKKKKQKDPLYKVAYRIIGSGGRYELWNAEDFEISKRKEGQKWFNKLPPELIERAQIYHHEKYPKGKRTELIENDPRAQALFNHLDSDDIEDDVGYWYGLQIYGVDGNSWVAADEDEMYDAMWEYFDNYADEDLFEYYDPEGYYLDMDDEEGFIDSEVEDYLDNLGEQEILEISGYIDRKSDLEEEISELKSRLEDEEDEDEIDELESEINDLEYDLENLVDEAKEEVGDSYRTNWEMCFQDGPVDCLVHEKGWFDVDGLWRSGLVSLRRTDLIEQLAYDGDWDTVTSGYGYDESEDDDGYQWIVFEVDY